MWACLCKESLQQRPLFIAATGTTTWAVVTATSRRVSSPDSFSAVARQWARSASCDFSQSNHFSLFHHASPTLEDLCSWKRSFCRTMKNLFGRVCWRPARQAEEVRKRYDIMCISRADSYVLNAGGRDSLPPPPLLTGVSARHPHPKAERPASQLLNVALLFGATKNGPLISRWAKRKRASFWGAAPQSYNLFFALFITTKC